MMVWSKSKTTRCFFMPLVWKAGHRQPSQLRLHQKQAQLSTQTRSLVQVTFSRRSIETELKLQLSPATQTARVLVDIARSVLQQRPKVPHFFFFFYLVKAWHHLFCRRAPTQNRFVLLFLKLPWRCRNGDHCGGRKAAAAVKSCLSVSVCDRRCAQSRRRRTRNSL